MIHKHRTDTYGGTDPMGTVSSEFEVDMFGDDIAEKLEEKTRRFYDKTFGRGVYEKVLSGNGRQLSLNKKDIKDQKQKIADQVTSQIKQFRDELRSLLERAEERDSTIDWEASRKAIEGAFTLPDMPDEPEYQEVPQTPIKKRYEPDLSLLDYLIPSRRKRKARKAVESFKEAKREWEEKRQEVWDENEQRREDFQQALEDWEEEVRQIEETKERELRRLEELREEYTSGEQEAVEKVIEAVLEESEYPSEDMISVKELAYDPEAQRIVVDVWMPSPEDTPKRKEVKYVKTRDAFKPKELSGMDLPRYGGRSFTFETNDD